MTVVTIPEAPVVALSNGVEMPRVALGTWPMDDAEAAFRVAQALCIGYRHVDTAENYGNETGVGEAIRKSGVPREKIFVTTKFNKKWHSRAGVRTACEAALKRLDTDYIDLFLVHWPNPGQNRYVEAFQGLVEVRKAGLVRAIGVSNFKPAHLQRLFDEGLVPQVNQIHLDPYHRRDDLVALHQAKGIVTESWSPVGRAGTILSDPSILAIASEHGRTVGQIILRWHVEHGLVPAPKSSDPLRQAQNLDIFSFKLSPEQMKVLDSLDRPDPEMLDSDVFGH
jgi:2,5-diketo-D-gluconate reductase A